MSQNTTSRLTAQLSRGGSGRENTPTCEQGPTSGSIGYTVSFSQESTAKITATEFSKQSCAMPVFSATVTAPVKISEHRVEVMRDLEKISASVNYDPPGTGSFYGKRLRELINTNMANKEIASKAPRTCFTDADSFDYSECLRWIVAKYIPKFGSKYQSAYKVSQEGKTLLLYGRTWQRLPSPEETAVDNSDALVLAVHLMRPEVIDSCLKEIRSSKYDFVWTSLDTENSRNPVNTIFKLKAALIDKDKQTRSDKVATLTLSRDLEKIRAGRLLFKCHISYDTLSPSER